MDVSQNLALPAAANVQTGPVVERAVTTKVQAVETSDSASTLPSDKPFVAQVVNARLSGADYPDNPAEIAPPERTLRPYDVPMLPAEQDEDDVMAKPLPEAAAVEAEVETETV
ncbi:MAG: hypothetical protein AAFU41_18470 [Pseudomonadota bacterium]